MIFEFFEAINMERDDPMIPQEYAEACAKAEEILVHKLKTA